MGIRDFRKRMAKAFATAEISLGQRPARAEVSRDALDMISQHIDDQFHRYDDPYPGDPVGKLWGAEIYVSDYLMDDHVVFAT